MVVVSSEKPFLSLEKSQSILRQLRRQTNLEMALRRLSVYQLDPNINESKKINLAITQLVWHDRFGVIAEYLWRQWYHTRNPHLKILPMALYAKQPKLQVKEGTVTRNFRSSRDIRITLLKKIVKEKQKSSTSPKILEGSL